MTIDLDQFSIRSDRRATQRALLRATAATPQRASVVRRHAVAFAVVAFAVLVAAPAFALVTLGPPWGEHSSSPAEASRETGVPVSPELQTTVDGVTWSTYVYREGSGGLCTAEQSNAHDSDTPQLAYGCETATRGPVFTSAPIRVYGPGMSRDGDAPPDRWDHLWLYGVAGPEVSRVVVRFTDCVERDALLVPASFEGNGVFAYVEPQDLLHAKVLPYELTAFDASGRPLLMRPLAANREPNGEPRRPIHCS